MLNLFLKKQTAPNAQDSSPEHLIRVGCPAHNCGGHCLLVAHVKDGVITHLNTDDRPDTLAAPQLRACVRGRAYRRRQYHPDRLKYPLKRTGKRGEGKFERISWDEALNTVAGETQRVKQTYGNNALFVPYGTGSYNQLNGSQTARRLMNLFGGCLGIDNSYSWGAINILPGVVNIPQGAWWTPDEDGVDRRGSVNVLTSEQWTPLAFGTAQHTIMVQVEKAKNAN